jgi:hypothetical protein
MKTGSEQRRDRLAAALRENLKRRKAAARPARKPTGEAATAAPEIRPAAAPKPA